MEKNNNSSLDSLMEQLLSAISPSLAAAVGQVIPDDGTVTITMTKDVYEKQQAALASITDLQSRVDAAEKRVAAAEMQANREKNRADNLQRDKNYYWKQAQDLKHQLHVSSLPNQQRAEYNKLRKNYTACCNQRDSFANTIGVQKQTIDEMRATIEKLQANPQMPCAVLIVDSVPYSPTDIRKIVEVSNSRDRENERLLRDLSTMTTLRDNAVKAGETLRAELDIMRNSAPDHEVVAKTMHDKDCQIAQYKKLYEDTVKLNERLRDQIKVYVYNGKPISDERLKQLCDLGGAAEDAGLTIDDLRALAAKNAEKLPIDTGSAGTVFVHRRLVNSKTDTIVIYDPENVHLCVHTYDGNTYDIDCDDIPDLFLRLPRERCRASRLEGDLGKVMQRNNSQAVSLRAAEREMANLRKTIDGLNKRVAEKDADIQRLTIERNLIRGQLNELRSAKTPKVNGQVLQAGEAYMTTCLGMLPINAEGMRRLSDTLDQYRAKVASLTKGLQEWIKA